MQNTAEYLEPLGKEKLDQIQKKFSNLTIVDEKLVQVAISKIRDKNTKLADFRRYADRVMRILIEQGLALQETQKQRRETPICQYDYVDLDTEKLVAVTIMRSGNSFLHELFQVVPDITIGMILIQRDENDPEKRPIHFYSKLPRDIADKKILLFDPMLGTGGSVIKAVEELLKAGVKEEHITFINLICSETGLYRVFETFKNISIITAAIDPVLITETKYIAPGLGDFGCRYYGTW